MIKAETDTAAEFPFVEVLHTVIFLTVSVLGHLPNFSRKSPGETSPEGGSAAYLGNAPTCPSHQARMVLPRLLWEAHSPYRPQLTPFVS